MLFSRILCIFVEGVQPRKTRPLITERLLMGRKESNQTKIKTYPFPQMFYQGYILTLIDYGSSTWGTTSRSNLERLSKLQKRAARIILNAPYDTASSDMFNALGWPTIEKRHSYNKAVLTYKALNNLTPLYITELLIPMSQTHNRALRSTSNGSLAVPRSKTAIFDGSFSCTAPRLWNQLPEVTKKASSLSCFKTQVKQFMFNE